MGHGSVIIAVGDELLGGFIPDSNSQPAARLLFHAGYPVQRMETVADRVDEIAATVRRAIDTIDVNRILVCGGIGPTPDDRTHAGVAQGLGRTRVEHPQALAHIQSITERMHRAGWVPTAAIGAAGRAMATVVEGAHVLANRRGMAAALALEVGTDRWLFILPGVPREFTTILEEEILPRFCAGGTGPVVRELRYAGAIEAEFVGAMTLLAVEFPDVSVGSYPQTELHELVVRLHGSDGGRVEAASHRLAELRAKPS